MNRLIKKMKWNAKLIYKTCNVWVFGRCQIVSYMTPPHPNSNIYRCHLILLFLHVKRKKLIKKKSNIKKKSESQN